LRGDHLLKRIKPRGRVASPGFLVWEAICF
jgi:hypothetical protein